MVWARNIFDAEVRLRILSGLTKDSRLHLRSPPSPAIEMRDHYPILPSNHLESLCNRRQLKESEAPTLHPWDLFGLAASFKAQEKT